MRPLNLPVSTASVGDWIRKAATVVNQLLAKAVLKDGAAIYTAPTAGAAYDQAQVQALMDAVEALSERLK